MSFRRHPFLDSTDIIGILDNSGNIVVKYTYDAWGNCTITLNTNGIATRNPIKYRGYYYDEDTKLYYLNARYYCPEWRRFISPAQNGALNPNAANGLNLYSYANNNPIGITHGGSSAGGHSSGGMMGVVSLRGLPISHSNSFNIFAGLTWSQFNVKNLVKDTFISLGEVGYRLAWGLTNNGSAFLDFHYSADGINGYTALDNLPSTSAKVFKRIGFGLMALDVIGAGYHSYQNDHSFSQGALNVVLTAGKNILVYQASTGVTTTVGTWAGAKLGTSLGSAAGHVGLVIGAVAGATIGWVIDEFVDAIIDWVVGWFD